MIPKQATVRKATEKTTTESRTEKGNNKKDQVEPSMDATWNSFGLRIINGCKVEPFPPSDRQRAQVEPLR